MKRPAGGQTLLLDSNVWRYVLDSRDPAALQREASARAIRIQVAPSVLYEALRVRDDQLRARLSKLLTHRSWSRLMPEAYDEAQEWLGEIRRLRPYWIRPKPDLDRIKRLRYDWQRPAGGFWDRARFKPAREAAALELLEGDMLPAARQQAIEARRPFRESGWRFETVRLDSVSGRIPLQGWSDADLELWRIQALAWANYTIGSRARAEGVLDWLIDVVDLDSARRSPDWTAFWLRDVEVTRMPRFWLRWAFEFLQALRKVNDGVPCDAQLGTYLTQTQWFATADKALADVIDKVRSSAPFSVAIALRVSAGSEVVYDLFSQLDAGEF